MIASHLKPVTPTKAFRSHFGTIELSLDVLAYDQVLVLLSRWKPLAIFLEQLWRHTLPS
jgi:hypothetical protein